VLCRIENLRRDFSHQAAKTSERLNSNSPIKCGSAAKEDHGTTTGVLGIDRDIGLAERLSRGGYAN